MPKKNPVLSYITAPFVALKDTYNLVLCALLMAISIAISSVSFYIMPELKISFTFLAIAIIGMRYGPLIAGVVSAMTDVFQFLLHPVGPFQPLLTLTALLTGIVYGIFLYKDKRSLWRIIVSRVIIYAFISSLLNSYFVSKLYGKVFLEFFVTRLIKNTILLPFEIALTILVLEAFCTVEKKIRR